MLIEDADDYMWDMGKAKRMAEAAMQDEELEEGERQLEIEKNKDTYYKLVVRMCLLCGFLFAILMINCKIIVFSHD